MGYANIVYSLILFSALLLPPVINTVIFANISAKELSTTQDRIKRRFMFFLFTLIIIVLFGIVDSLIFPTYLDFLEYIVFLIRFPLYGILRKVPTPFCIITIAILNMFLGYKITAAFKFFNSRKKVIVYTLSTIFSVGAGIILFVSLLI